MKAHKIFTTVDDGLRQCWDGLVLLNPPFGGRCGHLPWLHKFFDHGNGVAICRAYTSSWWFHEVVLPRAGTLLFPRGKTKFIRPDGAIGTAPGHGIALIGMGEVANTALQRSRLGWFVSLRRPAQPSIAQKSLRRQPSEIIQGQGSLGNRCGSERKFTARFALRRRLSRVSRSCARRRSQGHPRRGCCDARYAKQAKNRDAEANATELRLRATRRLDQLVRAQEKTTGLAKGGQPISAALPVGGGLTQ